MFKKYFWWIVLSVTIIYWGYFQLTRPEPCGQPIKYTIGSFDSHFNISKADFVSSIDSASQIWEGAIGKNLFEYDAVPKKGDLVINLIYDYRQKNADANKVLTSQIDESKQSADAIKQQFLSLQAQYKKSSQEYLSLVDKYKKRQIEYNTLEEKRLEVNRLADQVNSLVKKYNFLVSTVNSTIQSINQNAGQEFEEGLYTSDSHGEKIDIYEFEDKSTLVRVLAHELGHALGLDHNKNPESIMYYLNQSKNAKPTKEDVSALKVVCRMK